jgi:hypothetical protein
MASADEYERALAEAETENEALRTLLHEDERFFTQFLTILESAAQLGPATQQLLALLRERARLLDVEGKG